MFAQDDGSDDEDAALISFNNRQPDREGDRDIQEFESYFNNEQ